MFIRDFRELSYVFSQINIFIPCVNNRQSLVDNQSTKNLPILNLNVCCWGIVNVWFHRPVQAAHVKPIYRKHWEYFHSVVLILLYQLRIWKLFFWNCCHFWFERYCIRLSFLQRRSHSFENMKYMMIVWVYWGGVDSLSLLKTVKKNNTLFNALKKPIHVVFVP